MGKNGFLENLLTDVTFQGFPVGDKIQFESKYVLEIFSEVHEFENENIMA